MIIQSRELSRKNNGELQLSSTCSTSIKCLPCCTGRISFTSTFFFNFKSHKVKTWPLILNNNAVIVTVTKPITASIKTEFKYSQKKPSIMFMYSLKWGTPFHQLPSLGGEFLSITEIPTSVQFSPVVNWKAKTNKKQHKNPTLSSMLHFQMHSTLWRPWSFCLCKHGLLRADEAGKAHARIRLPMEP